MLHILNLIQIASLHLEKFIDRDTGTDGCNNDSKKENGTTRNGKLLPSHHQEQFWLSIALLTKGRRMNPQEAPTSFIVCIEKRRA